MAMKIQCFQRARGKVARQSAKNGKPRVNHVLPGLPEGLRAAVLTAEPPPLDVLAEGSSPLPLGLGV